jgi:UDP-GlcNAc:undecaprenyl-phosphate GlcNAc-1-phosphate transferase
LTIVFIVGAMCAICATGALVSVFFKSEAMAVATLAAVLGTLVATRFFGHSECHLLWQKVGGAAASLVRLPHRVQPESKTFKSRFQGKRKWEDLWEALLELAERFDLHSVRMNVSSPSIGEEYHASWERQEQPAANRVWKTELPLTVGRLTVGRMIISGSVTGQSAFGHLADFVDSLRPFEDQFLALLQAGNETEGSETVSQAPGTTPIAP